MPWPRRPSAARADAARRRRAEAGDTPPSGSSLPDEIGTRLAARSDRDEALPCGDEALPCETPVFLCAAGWRSGSTLLQRMCMHDPSVLVWGEPLDRCEILQSLAAAWRPVGAAWPNPRHLLEPGGAPPGSDDWIANLSPPLEALRRAQRRFLDALFGEPARAAGRARWGLKEVRLGSWEIRCLRMLFPAARFVLLVRDPVDAFASYAPRGPWFESWPDRPVTTAPEFAALWSRLVGEFLDLESTPGVLPVRYDELDARRDELAAHLDLDLARPSQLQRIGGGATVHDDRRASPAELRTIGRLTEDLRHRLGMRSGMRSP